MPVNSLTTSAGLRIGPVVLETLVKHYFDRITDSQTGTKLRKDELLYDEAFNIVKAFLEASCYHTVEEVQGFSNTRTPSPPWVHFVRLVIPMSCCDEAANILIKALGGEDVARRVVGGVKWWQVRGIAGIDAQWITAKKDWQEAKRRYKMQEKSKASSTDDPPDLSGESAAYEQDMDEMRCILYSHGGGYYFGSVDQERYSIQRHARKINGRVFAVDYRLAPQYPFPCALQDLIAAYLYLIRPPPEAKHRPVKPAHITIAGDSAGGGLSLALLQVIRDTGLPMPAGGVLISPWCDLTHSFPSIHTNTATDVIPPYGLSLQKPSTLWPPPSDEFTDTVHAGLRSRIRQTFHMVDHTHDHTTTMFSERHIPESTSPAPTSPNDRMPINVGATASLPSLDSFKNQTISLTTPSGEVLSIDQQIHLYAQNSLLSHPLVSSAFSYLGGLPPLLFIASDKEVLRDEIIYAAHKAANPEKFPLKENIRSLYPPLDGIESRYKATPVHLQVYDDTAHVLPVLFSFTTPAKYCYRAIALFCKQVTGMRPTIQSPIYSTYYGAGQRPAMQKSDSVSSTQNDTILTSASSLSVGSKQLVASPEQSPAPSISETQPPTSPTSPPKKKRLGRSISHNFASVLSLQPKRAVSVGNPSKKKSAAADGDLPPVPTRSALRDDSAASGDVGGPRFKKRSLSLPLSSENVRLAGDPVVYSDTPEFPSFNYQMIRERVSTQGVIRPLEPEADLDALNVPPEILGVISELAMKRYIEGRSKFDRKFASTIKAIEKHRKHNLERSGKDINKNMSLLQDHLEKEKKHKSAADTKKGIKEGLMAASGSWAWAWVLDGEERPPPSSIASRRDTGEARRLAKVADQGVFQDESSLSGNNLWTVMVNFLTVGPDKKKHVGSGHGKDGSENSRSDSEKTSDRRKSMFSRFMPKEWGSPETKENVN